MSIGDRVPKQREIVTPVLALQSFSVRFPKFTLHPLSLTFRAGERVALVGPNGAGKTTVMKGLAGRLPVYQGAVQFGGAEMRSLLPDARARIGFLPETLAAFGWMSVAEHLEFLSAFYPSWDGVYATELAARLDLPLDHKVGTLSRGTKVKLSFVAAEAFRPPVLLLDEPTSGLDPVVRRELIDAIGERFPPSGDRLVVFSTHILEDVEWLADRVLVLAGGVLCADATVVELRRGRTTEPLSQILYALLADDRTPPLRRAAEG
ncbi:MAG: ABC transporter ATP-binding protein [Gemmatimonadales bacterium]|jgi:ABC-2 type transport system ATP-binding protein